VTTDPLLSRPQLEEALRALGDQLRDRKVTGEIYLFGGGALVLGFGARDATRDLDGRFDAHHGAVQAAAAQVAQDLGLPRHWLNEGGTVYLPRGADAAAAVVYRDGWLTVRAASAPVLLAMKARARRAQDVVDTVFLGELLGLTTADEIAAIHDEYYADDPLTDDARARLAAIEQILAQGPEAPEGLGEVIIRARAQREKA
jgi:hypothetical protein